MCRQKIGIQRGQKRGTISTHRYDNVIYQQVHWRLLPQAAHTFPDVDFEREHVEAGNAKSHGWDQMIQRQGPQEVEEGGECIEITSNSFLQPAVPIARLCHSVWNRKNASVS